MMIIHMIWEPSVKNKKEPTGEVDPKTGKKIYREVPDKFEFWLVKFTVKNNVEEVVQDI